jgi:hypothetical protein
MPVVALPTMAAGVLLLLQAASLVTSTGVEFGLNEASGWAMEMDGKFATKFHINETHLLLDDVMYLLSSSRSDDNNNSTTDPETPPTTTDTAMLLSIFGGLLFVILVSYKVHSGKEGRRRVGRAKRVAEPSYGATKAELTEGLMACVEIKGFHANLIPVLLKLGADASVRVTSGQLPHALALQSLIDLATYNMCLTILCNESTIQAVESLFRAHVEFDAQIGACLRSDDGSKNSGSQLVEKVLCEMASASWRSVTTGDTVAHSARLFMFQKIVRGNGIGSRTCFDLMSVYVRSIAIPGRLLLF